MKCSICKKGGCTWLDRNTDGTYAHSGCLYATSLVVTGKGPKGGNLFAETVGEKTSPGTAPPTGTSEQNGG